VMGEFLDKRFYDLSDDIDLLIRRSRLDLNEIAGKKILVTGGTGFFGIWLILTLIEIKNRVKGDLEISLISRDPTAFLARHKQHTIEKFVTFLIGDIKTIKIRKSVAATHVFHMATTAASETFGGERSINKLDMLYQGTGNLLAQLPDTTEAVLFTSSGVAYGDVSADAISENDFGFLDPIDPNSALGIGKLSAEHLIGGFAKEKGYKFSIARCFSFAGPYLPLHLHYAFGNFVRQSLLGEDITIQGDGQDRRSYLYIGDAIAWLLRLIFDPKDSIFNVGSDEAVTIKELAEQINMLSKGSSSILIENEPTLTGNFRRKNYVPNTSKISSIYPELYRWTSLDETIKRTLQIR